jgi:opacity protein-like surface antigen
MKRMLHAAVALVLVSLVAASAAQAQTGRANFFLGGGATIPTGDFGDAFKTGWNGVGGVNFMIPGVPFGIRVDGMYSQNSLDSSIDGKAKIFGGNADAVFAFGAPGSMVKPYIMAGVGMANVKFDIGGTSDDETKFAFNGGAGVNFLMSSMTVFVEARYFSVNTSGSSINYIPLSVGLKFGGR